MILELFFVVLFSSMGGGYVMYLNGWDRIGKLMILFPIILIWKRIISPVIKNWTTVTSVETATFRYYERTKFHRDWKHPVVQAFAKPKADWVASRVDLSSKKILDVGGGAGFFTQYLMQKSPQTHVLDISPEQLRMNPLPAAQKHEGTAYELPFKDGEFDLVFCSNLLHHLDNPLKALKEMVRVSKDYVVISEPSTANPMLLLGSLMVDHEFGARKSSKKFLLKLLDDAGLEPVDHTFQGGMVLPNRTPQWSLPLAFPNTFSSLSYFQIFIARKKSQASNKKTQ